MQADTRFWIEIDQSCQAWLDRLPPWPAIDASVAPLNLTEELKALVLTLIIGADAVDRIKDLDVRHAFIEDARMMARNTLGPARANHRERGKQWAAKIYYRYFSLMIYGFFAYQGHDVAKKSQIRLLLPAIEQVVVVPYGDESERATHLYNQFRRRINYLKDTVGVSADEALDFFNLVLERVVDHTTYLPRRPFPPRR